MNLLSTAIRYLKRYPLLSVLTVISISASSFFEGVSFVMIIPLMQSMLDSAAILPQGLKIPLIDRLGSMLASMDQIAAISFIFMMLFIAIVMKNIFYYFSNVFIARLRHSLARDLKIELVNNLMLYDMKYFDNVKTGHIITVANNETMRVGDFIFAVLNSTVLLGRIVVYVLALFLLSPKATFVAFASVAFVLIVVELLIRKIKKIGERVSSALAECNYKLTEILGGIKLIKTCCAEFLEKNEFKIAADNVYKAELAEESTRAVILPLSEVMTLGLVVTSFLVLINFVKIDIKASFPVIATYLLIMFRTLTQLYDFNSRRSNAIARLAAVKRYDDVLSIENKHTIKNGKIGISRFSGSIDFKNVIFCYLEGKQVISGINLKIPRGKITAIVGRSGSGKSTLINLMLRFYDVVDGAIFVDNVNIKDVELFSWRKKIGFVSQDVFIFNTSVMNNISYGLNVSEEEVVRAARIANAHDFITGMAEGYKTVLGERGVKLSGGQKQRISIARAVIHNPEILILDEATSSLDTETERMIKDSIDKITRERTVIAVAHRLSTVIRADNIVVLEKGRIVECGDHKSLVDLKGVYAKLYESQFI